MVKCPQCGYKAIRLGAAVSCDHCGMNTPLPATEEAMRELHKELGRQVNKTIRTENLVKEHEATIARLYEETAKLRAENEELKDEVTRLNEALDVV